MTEGTQELSPPIIVAVQFAFGGKTYDYYSRVPVEVGQTVIVKTSRGEAAVTVAAIKKSSPLAQQFIVRAVEAGAKS